ncbi:MULTISPECIES: PhnD/SsuA/transferrin family substrate-binding protein [Haloprofundus]|uniref:PhnD/SsuA/transferrin family substrate-binding protein n=1 Tax=Haloprofundus TaxID=1911573 RepID=UPI000E448664|nr:MULTISPECIES: PhnD/SsuA/transferrin family substrate-binding protein [Haloprofundus]QCJ47090.1 twin-arginine translocation signal domain-containing protein [Haloprofundus sp. MHR1]
MSDKFGWASNRRTFLKATGAAGIAGLAGCTDGGSDGDAGGDNQTGGNESGATAGEADSESVVRFILNPAEADVEITEQYQPMFEYLESEASVTIEPSRADSYTATLQAIRNDQGEIADTSPSAAIAGEDVVDVIGIRVAYGAAQYFSLITTTTDSGISQLSDLQGEQVYMGDILSVSGTLVPLTILKDAGLDIGNAPDGDAADFDAEYSDHTTAKEQMIARDDVAAATTGAFSTAAHVPKAQFDEMSQDFVDISAEYENAGTEDPELNLLAVSDPLPRAPLVSRSNWDDSVREDVEQAILNVSEDDLSHGDDYDGEPLWFTGVQEGTIDDYEPIAKVLDELGLEFEDLS